MKITSVMRVLLLVVAAMAQDKDKCKQEEEKLKSMCFPKRDGNDDCESCMLMYFDDLQKACGQKEAIELVEEICNPEKDCTEDAEKVAKECDSKDNVQDCEKCITDLQPEIGKFCHDHTPEVIQKLRQSCNKGPTPSPGPTPNPQCKAAANALEHKCRPAGDKCDACVKENGDALVKACGAEEAKEIEGKICNGGNACRDEIRELQQKCVKNQKETCKECVQDNIDSLKKACGDNAHAAADRICPNRAMMFERALRNAAKQARKVVRNAIYKNGGTGLY